MAKNKSDLVKSKKGLKSTKKSANKSGKVDQYHPDVDNKDSLTENLKRISGDSIKDAQLGKTMRIPMNPRLPKKK